MCLPNQDFHKCACKIICRIAQIVEVCLHLTNCYNFESSLASQTPILKEAIRNEVRSLYFDIWKEKVEKLVSQGSLLSCLSQNRAMLPGKASFMGCLGVSWHGLWDPPPTPLPLQTILKDGKEWEVMLVWCASSPTGHQPRPPFTIYWTTVLPSWEKRNGSLRYTATT